MTLFPFFENIEEKTFLLVGGGRVAAEKLRKLEPFSAKVLVVAPETSIPETDRVQVRLREFETTDLDGADYVIGATNDRELNRRISLLCQERRIPVNVVDDPELCTFISPSLVKRGDAVVGITTAGKSPAFSQYVRRLLEQKLPENTEDIIDELYALKQELKETVPEQKERARILKARLEELV